MLELENDKLQMFFFLEISLVLMSHMDEKASEPSHVIGLVNKDEDNLLGHSLKKLKRIHSFHMTRWLIS